MLAFVLLQTCGCLKEHMREVITYVFCALYIVFPGSAVSWNRQDCNRLSMQRVQNTWSIGTGLCLIIIIMIFYCGLMVHITDTTAQKVVSYTSAHITQTVFAHDQHWEGQSSLSSPQLYRHSQKHRKWITIQ